MISRTVLLFLSLAICLPVSAEVVTEELTYRQIADALECSEGTVKSRLHRGRQLLKQKLVPYWNGG